MSKPVPDFTGHWKQVKNENADAYLKVMGAPYVVRRVAVPIMGRSTDIVKQAGDLQVVTTINAKGAWTRKYIIGKEIEQKNAEGDDTVATCWWDTEDGKLMHKSKLVGGKRGVSESYRYYDGGLMVIKSITHCKNGKQAWMLWFFESIEQPSRSDKYISAKKKLKQITKEQKLIAEITEKQTEEMQAAMKDLTLVQQTFVTELLSKVKNSSKDSKAGSSPSSAVSKWKKKAKVNSPDSPKPQEKETPAAEAGAAADEFYDCEDLTNEQAAALDAQAKQIEDKVMTVNLEEGVQGEVKTFFCFPVKSVKRLPTIVLNSLKDTSTDGAAK